jgi:uncharacterized membrane protein
MTETTTATEQHPAAPPIVTKPATDAEAVKANAEAVARMRQRAAEIRQAPAQHKPKLVISDHVRGASLLDKIADAVNRFCGSMYVFIGITVGILAWLILGPLLLFDKVPWPLLLTILNLPQLSIMISLQVSANRAQTASDRRAIADHETLIALHEMAKQQIDILHGQDQVLALLNQFASKDMPGMQQRIAGTADKILAIVGGQDAAS